MSLTRALIIGGAIALAVPAGAQDWKGQGRVEGFVFGADGKPLPDATIKLNNPQRGGGPTVKTDKKGHWAVLGIVAGNWEFDIEAPGYAVSKKSFILSGESERLPPIKVTMEKAAATGPPPEVMAALEKGNQLFEKGDYANARAEYEKLMSPEYEKLRAANPSLMTNLHKQIAFTYSKEKNYAKELEELQKVLDADPTNTDMRSLMAMEALEGGMLDKGMELLKGIDETNIKNPDVFFNVGVNLLNKGQPQAAIDYFTKSVTVDPKYVDGYFQRGLTLVGLGKIPEAKEDFKKVLELAPNGPQAETAKKVLETYK